MPTSDPEAVQRHTSRENLFFNTTLTIQTLYLQPFLLYIIIDACGVRLHPSKRSPSGKNPDISHEGEATKESREIT